MEFNQIESDEITVVFPNSLLGEAGEPLPEVVISVIHAMAGIGYWVFDFGEDDSFATGLIFSNKDLTGTTIKEMNDHFIAKGGYV
jgi:hypothetical protein